MMSLLVTILKATTAGSPHSEKDSIMAPVIGLITRRVGFVMETTDYNRFKFIKGNREIRKDHVAAMRLVLEAGGKIDHLVIVVEVNGEYHVLDGQHLLDASKLARVPFRYLVVEDNGENLITRIQNMNCHQEPWESKDYLKSFIDFKKAPYIRLNKFMIDREMTNVDLAIILLGHDQSSRSMKIFRLGGYKHDNPEQAEALADKRISMIGDFLNPDKGNLPFAWCRNFVRAVNQLSTIPNYDHTKMLRRVKRSGMKKQASVEQFMEELRARYNSSSTSDFDRI